MHHLLQLKTDTRIVRISLFSLTKHVYCSLSIRSPPTLPSQSLTNPHEINCHIISSNKKITSYVRCGDLNSALRVFRSMKVRTTVSWNSILAGFSSKPGKLREARQVFDEMAEPDNVSYNLMLACYFINGDVVAAKDFFDKIPVRDTVSWNTMISGLSRNGMMDEARELFTVIPRRNAVTWNAMISGYVDSGNMESALELFAGTPVKCVVAWTSIITGYMKSGKVELAEKTFHGMVDKNLVTWNAMISGYVENGRGEDALKLFKKMMELEIQGNPSSLSSVLLACSNLSMLKLGKQIHQLIFKSPVYLDTKVGTSVISMYCKCGVLEDGWKLFMEMQHKDAVTWNALISGYAHHGVSHKALSLFDEMRDQGTKPDWITFIGVLSACNHAGLVELGIHYFEKMQKDYGIGVKPDHYTCMIDLLGRAGKLNDALDLIKRMPFEPPSVVYGALLGACRVHKNLEIAEFAATKLLNLEPSNPFAYVQLANVYAAMKKWESVCRVRRAMKDIKAIKTPGYSWIEIKSVIHEFRSGDRFHPELESIHNKLNELQKKMKVAGYVPDLESVLHDVTEDQKEQLLLWHNEKLAIAFGIINLPVGVPIRVFKNLRVCDDCHLATKYISAVEGREIIVRDTTRFHHFQDGKCSCGDYW
ncbi:Tetratricopeptide repeat superfamily protein [Perilla frutescens var. frutescens]|nr:Tetratricopeptide repeat superfamily protein [Perilla frutescens var. frutescens]